MTEQRGVLKGLRVLDFGRYIAGPFCGAILSDLGAEVIRIEDVRGGYDREFVPVTADGVGAVFLQCNRGKRGFALDLTSSEAAAILDQLLRTSDVVITNAVPSVLKANGLDYPSLKQHRSEVIAVNISAWGSGGEWGEQVGFDGLAQAASGAVYLSGPQGSPTRTFSSYVDFSTATIAALSVLVALRHREQTGNGQFIEAALFRTALAWNSTALIEEAMLGIDRIPTHNRGQTAGPSDLFRARDGWIMCLVVGPQQFKRWAQMIGREDLVTDVRFASDASRGKHGAELSSHMNDWCADKTTAECLAGMADFRIPGGPVLAPRETLASRHVAEIDAFDSVPYPGTANGIPLVTFPSVFSESEAKIRSRAPLLGEHTEEILQEFGYTQEAIADLRNRGVI